MQFLHNDLGHLDGSEVIEVTLDTAANVKLMDTSDFGSYRNGRGHNYFGGYATRSPYRVPVPRSGHWHLTIDLAGRSGNVRYGVQVLR